MGIVGAFTGPEMIAEEVENLSSTWDGLLRLSSVNLAPDPGVRNLDDAGWPVEWPILGSAPKPSGWGSYVKGPGTTPRFREQNLIPLSLGGAPTLDLFDPLILGPEPPDTTLAIAQPDKPLLDGLTTTFKGFPSGYIRLSYAYSLGGDRITPPSNLSEAIRVLQGEGVRVTFPESLPPNRTVILYVSWAASEVGTLNATRRGQFRFQTGSTGRQYNPARTLNRLAFTERPVNRNTTKLSPYAGGTRAYFIRTPGEDTRAMQVQAGHVLYDVHGVTGLIKPTRWINVVGDKIRRGNGEIFETAYKDNVGVAIKPTRIPVGSTGYKPYFRFKFVESVEGRAPVVTISRWATLGSTSNPRFVFKRGTRPIPTIWDSSISAQARRGYPRGYPWRMYALSPPGKDSTGISGPTDVLEAPVVVNLNASQLPVGTYDVKNSLYFGDYQESQASESSRIVVTSLGQGIEIGRPLFVNRMDNPEAIVLERDDPSKPRKWRKPVGRSWTVTPGKVTINHSGPNSGPGPRDLGDTPQSHIDPKRLHHILRMKLNIKNRVNGRLNLILKELDGLGNDIRQKVIGSLRRNGTYNLSKRLTRGKPGRNKIQLHPNTRRVKVNFQGLGNVNFNTEISKVGGFSGNFHPLVRWPRSPVPAREPEDLSYPHGGYCVLVDEARGLTLGGGKVNVPENPAISNIATSERTIEVCFRTGEDVNSQQVIYEEGNDLHGYNIIIANGLVQFAAWAYGDTPVRSTAAVEENTEYTAALVHDGNDPEYQFHSYLDGSLIEGFSGPVEVPARIGGACLGGVYGTTRGGSNGTATATGNNLLGDLIEARVWSVARSELDISGELNSDLKGDEEGLGLLYEMKETFGATVHDNGPYLAHATISGVYEWLDNDGPFDDLSEEIAYEDFEEGNLGWNQGGAGTALIGPAYSISDYSDYGAQIASPSSLRSVEGQGDPPRTEGTVGGKYELVTLPTAQSDLLRVEDMNLIVDAGVSLDQLGTLRFTAGGTTVIVDSEMVLGDRFRLEARVYNYDTTGGTAILYMAYMDESIERMTSVARIDGINLTGKFYGGGGVLAESGAKYNVGQLRRTRYGSTNIRRLSGRYFEYYGPEGTPLSQEYGPLGYKVPVTPDTVNVLSVYAWNDEIGRNSALLSAVVKNSKGETLQSLPYLVPYGEYNAPRPWSRYHISFEANADARYIEFTKNQLGEGLLRVGMFQVDRPDPNAEELLPQPYTDENAVSGYVRRIFEGATPGAESDQSMRNLGRQERLHRILSIFTADRDTELPDVTTVITKARSGPTKDGPWSSYVTNVYDVPLNRFYDVRVEANTTDTHRTPEISGFGLSLERPLPILCDSDGREYYGGVLVRNLGYPDTERLLEFHEYDDGGRGFTEWSDPDNPPLWFNGFEVECYRDETKQRLTADVGKGNSYFVIEAHGKRYTVQILEMKFSHNRAIHGTNGTRLYTATGIRARIIHESPFLEPEELEGA